MSRVPTLKGDAGNAPAGVLLRFGNGSKFALKEKFVQVYEVFFKVRVSMSSCGTRLSICGRQWRVMLCLVVAWIGCRRHLNDGPE